MVPILAQLCILSTVGALLDEVDPSTLQNELTSLRTQVATMAGQMATLQQTVKTMQGQLSMALVSFRYFDSFMSFVHVCHLSLEQ